AIAISGVFVAIGIANFAGSAYKLHLAEGQKIEAETNLSNARANLDIEKQVILELSKDLGAKVQNNIISYEGLPQQIRAILGGSSLNMVDMNMLNK
ncbi:MAG: hypothetical protein ABL958_03275, partial [Bdellovibrionia bacterium]